MHRVQETEAGTTAPNPRPHQLECEPVDGPYVQVVRQRQTVSQQLPHHVQMEQEAALALPRRQLLPPLLLGTGPGLQISLMVVVLTALQLLYRACAFMFVMVGHKGASLRKHIGYCCRPGKPLYTGHCI